MVLSALNHLEALVKDPKVTQWGSVDLLHAQIESLRLAFFDALHENADPECCSVPLATLIDKDDAANQRTFHKLSRQVSNIEISFLETKLGIQSEKRTKKRCRS